MLKKILLGKKAIITGGNQGLGLQIARNFIYAGADIMICARNINKLKTAQKELRGISSSGQKIMIQETDVSSENDVIEAVNKTLNVLDGCHILVNNAGIYGPKGNIETVNWTEWIRAIEINLYGSILMSKALLPHLKKQNYGKIIQLSGGGATNPLPHLSSYAVSKAAIVRYAETLAEEVRFWGIDVNCIAPGALNTKMLDEILSAGPKLVGKNFFERSLKQKKEGGTPLKKGADLALFLASDASNGITGKLISAVWDNWENWPQNKVELSKSDVYTLRRITGRDRGLKWGDK